MNTLHTIYRKPMLADRIFAGFTMLALVLSLIQGSFTATIAEAVVLEPNSCGEEYTYTFDSKSKDDYGDDFTKPANVDFIDTGAYGKPDSITVTADSGYKITKVELSMDKGNFVNYALPVTTLNPTGLTISKAKVTVKKDCEDLCPNIDGDQVTIPEGKYVDNKGNCVETPKVTICHATGGSNYVKNTPAKTADAGGHAGIEHQNGDDIIPPFEIIGGGSFPGQNWDAEGQAIWNDGGCDGTYTPPATDVCPNIEGVQESVPAGMVLDNGNCVTPLTDLCPNIEGVQETVPSELIVDNSGNCVTPPTDVCPNLEGAQTEVPAGYTLTDGTCIAPVDMCPNIPETQESIPAGLIVDNSGNCVTPPNDVCTNLEGVQEITPEGYENNDGTCVLPVDVCSNMEGAQATVPEGYEVTENGCFLIPDTCNDISASNYGQEGDCEYPEQEEEYCTVEIVSDTTNTVTEKANANALILSYIHPAWTASISGANWIWGDNPVTNPVADETQTFKKSFYWNGPVTNATLEIASDNSYSYDINGTLGADATEKNFTLAGQDSYDVTSAIVAGNNNLAIAVKNWAGSSNPQDNPAGLLYKLTVKGTNKNCGEEPKTEEITICKYDQYEKLLSGWTMTVSNGETSNTYVTGENGCVTVSVDPDNGPWQVTEEDRVNWDLQDVSVQNGDYLYTKGTEQAIGCSFFNNEEVIEGPQIARVAVYDPSYTCSFMNEFNEKYGECLTDNLLVNASFEEPVINTDWTTVANPLGWVVKKNADTTDANLEFHRNWSGNTAAHGMQYVELGGNEPSNITQNVVTEDGALYKLWWSFAPRQDTVAEENILSVLVNGTEVATEGPTAGLGVLGQDDWKNSSYTFTGTASTDVAFKDAGTGPLGSYGTFVDNAYLCKVRNPENDNDGDDGDGETRGGGGGCTNCNNDDDDDDGDVQGSSTKRERTSSDDESPKGSVQGAQTTRVPTVAGASTGAGGTSQNSMVPLFALVTLLASSVVLRKETTHGH